MTRISGGYEGLYYYQEAKKYQKSRIDSRPLMERNLPG